MPMYILGMKIIHSFIHSKIILNGFGKNNFEHAFLEKIKKKVNNAFCGSLELTLHPLPHTEIAGR
jgi:hypothetical protein